MGAPCVVTEREASLTGDARTPSSVTQLITLHLISISVLHLLSRVLNCQQQWERHFQE